MTIHDRVYGKFEIADPLIIELTNSSSVQRLKNISQFGVPDEFYHLKNYSRFEHSLGVMLLLKLLKASKEEQVAGLLHDVSHTAFSHVYDWILGRGHLEDYQDNIHHQKLVESEIGRILEKYGFDPNKIADHQNFPLLDTLIPNLCADRIDYAIREFPLNIAKYCLSGFVIVDNKIFAKNRNFAHVFAIYFLKRQVNHWGGFEAVTRYKLFADALKLALKDKLIKQADFTNDEKTILTKLKASKNKKIQQILSLLRHKSLTHLPKSSKIYHKKFRFVDPEIADENGRRLSKVDANFTSILAKSKAENEKGIRVVKII